MSNSPIVVTSTDQLSQIADAILTQAGNPRLTKNTVLNLIAAGISGPKHNWGFLKSQAGPIMGRGLNLADLSIAPPREDPSADFLLEDGGIAVRFTDPASGKPMAERVLISCAEVLMADATLFGANPKSTFGAAEVILEAQGDRIFAKRRIPGGAIASASMNLAKFARLIEVNEDAIFNGFLATEAGDAVLSAFIMIAETDTTIQDAEQDNESGSDFGERITIACQRASLRYTIDAAADPQRAHLLRTGQPYEIVDDIVDHHWTLLIEELQEN